MGKVIFHIDVNSAFLSWGGSFTALYHLGGSVDLREQVSAVGGDMAMRHGIILAKSIPAKRYIRSRQGRRFWKHSANAPTCCWYRPIMGCMSGVLQRL